MNAFMFSGKTIDGEDLSFSSFTGKILLVVNTASKGQGICELARLQKVQEMFSDRLIILAFPCRQFLKQESKDRNKIIHRYRDDAKITFPIFELTKVYGESTNQFYAWLKSQVQYSNNEVEWNFSKFLVNQNGIDVKKISSTVSYTKLEKMIKEMIATNQIPKIEQSNENNCENIVQNTE